MISVALCTCNGGLYLQSLLDSLLLQTCQPVEVVAHDDVSTDETLAALQQFSLRAHFPVLVKANQTRLGACANFEQAIIDCTGDFIALCDQDDIWLPAKLEKLVTVLTANPDVVGVFSNALVVDENRQPLGYTQWESVNFTSSRQRQLLEDLPWDVLYKHPVVSGATFAFRRDLLPFILPIPGDWLHDAWIAQIAASQGRLAAINEPLILYRQHAGNAIGGKKLSFLDQIRRVRALGRIGLVERELRRYESLRKRLYTFPANHRRDVMLAMAEEKLEHLARRYNLPANRLLRWPTVMHECLNGNYRRFAKDWRNIAADLFMP